MRKITQHFLKLLFIFFAANMIFTGSAAENMKYEKLFRIIEKIQLIDDHAHPVAGHVKYEERDRYPTLEPLIGRPFWPTKKERIGVFDTMQAEALKKIYGFDKDDVSDEDMPDLEKLSLEFWKSGKRQAFNKMLDICGIEKVFSNSGSAKKDLDPERVLWVPFVDSLFYPLEPSLIKSINADLKEALTGYYKRVEGLSKKHDIQIIDLDAYLELIDQLLFDYEKNGAKALKVGSAYIRTLWFDKVDRSEAVVIFKEGMVGKISSWERYKRLQDFIARYIFLRAGELDLPVHFHTGFGATATLKNLDSNPLNLESVFSDMEFEKTRIVMLHAGYPFWDKLKPLLEKRNIYVEFSAVNWMIYEDELSKILYEWLSYPGASEKIMFGSDAGTPVFFWIAANNSRRALYIALSQLIDRRIINEEKAVIIAKNVMRENALRVHNLN